MALEELLRALEREAEQDIATVRAEADAEVQRIAAAAGARSARRKEQALAEEERTLRDRAGAELAQVRRDAEGEVLRERRRVLDRVYGIVASRLGEVQASDAYRRGLADRVLSALGYAGDAPATLICHASLHEAIQRIAGGRTGVRVVADPAGEEGFRVVVDETGFVVDERIAARLEQMRPDLDIALVATIEGERSE